MENKIKTKNRLLYIKISFRKNILSQKKKIFFKGPKSLSPSKILFALGQQTQRENYIWKANKSWKSGKISILYQSAKGAMKYNFFMCDTSPFPLHKIFHQSLLSLSVLSLQYKNNFRFVSFFQSSFFLLLINASKSHKNLYRNQFFLIHLQPYLFDIFIRVCTFREHEVGEGGRKGSEVQWGKYNEKLFDKISFRW